VRRTWSELELSVKFVNLFRLHLPPEEGGADRASFKKFSAMATNPNEVNFIGIYVSTLDSFVSVKFCLQRVAGVGADKLNFYWHY